MDLKNRGKTIVMVSHDLDFCGQYADRCGLFAQENLLVLITLENFLQKTNFIPHLLTKWQEEV